MSKTKSFSIINNNTNISAKRLKQEYVVYLEKLKKLQNKSSELIAAFEASIKKQKNIQSNP